MRASWVYYNEQWRPALCTDTRKFVACIMVEDRVRVIKIPQGEVVERTVFSSIDKSNRDTVRRWIKQYRSIGRRRGISKEARQILRGK